MAVALSPDGKRLLSGGDDRTMRLWDLETSAEISASASHPKPIWSVALSPDGKTAVSGCADGNVRVWDLGPGRAMRTFKAHKGLVWTVAFTPDGSRVVTGGGNTFFGNKSDQPTSLVLWDLATGAEVRRFEGHTRDVRRAIVSRDGTRLLSASFDGSARLWDLETGKELRRFDSPGNFADWVEFTPDGKRAVCSYGPQTTLGAPENDPRCCLLLWDLATGREIKRFKGHTSPVLNFTVARDRPRMLSGCNDGTMRLWELPE